VLFNRQRAHASWPQRLNPLVGVITRPLPTA